MTQAEKQSTQQDVHKVTRNDLPLSCPRPGETLASLHPRVYLPIEKSGTATCPYCGTIYQLSD
ncbi:MAG: zinc-finger domain-containing protein [Candidatus Thiodiazotropha sp. 6PLUC2]